MPNSGEESAGDAASSTGDGSAPVGLLGLSNQVQAGGWRQVSSERSYWLQERNPASFTDSPGVNVEPPSAQLGGSVMKLSVWCPRE